jgi:phosphohistidine swiveling domain-containing protein
MMTFMAAPAPTSGPITLDIVEQVVLQCVALGLAAAAVLEHGGAGHGDGFVDAAVGGVEVTHVALLHLHRGTRGGGVLVGPEEQHRPPRFLAGIQQIGHDRAGVVGAGVLVAIGDDHQNLVLVGALRRPEITSLDCPPDGIKQRSTAAGLVVGLGEVEYLDILHADGDDAARLAELGTRLPAVDEFVRSIGFRLVDGFDITFPTGLERPQVLLGRLDAALEVDPSEAIARADALAAALRERVPAEHIAEFDDLLAESRYVNRLRDERGLYSDVAAVGILRLALLEYGSRLAQRGAINTPSDILAINGGELADLRTGGSTLSASDLAERSAWVAAISDHGAPRYLGDPPPDPPPMDQLPPPLARVMQAIGFGIEGILGQLDEAQGDETHVAGIGVHEGVYEGPVYLVSSIDDLFEIQQGDVLVSQTTGGAFNSMIHLVGAIVTDHGSYISHAAIVARECGLPAVVGCINATERLQQGQRVRVDGGTGEVIVLA